MKDISALKNFDSFKFLHKHYSEKISLEDIVNVTREFKNLWNSFCDALDNGEVSQLERYAVRFIFCDAHSNFDRHIPGFEEFDGFVNDYDSDEYIYAIYLENQEALVSCKLEELDKLTEKYGDNIIPILEAVGAFVNSVYVVAFWINMYSYVLDEYPDGKPHDDWERQIFDNRPPKFQPEPSIQTTEPYVIRNEFLNSEHFKTKCCNVWDTLILGVL